jgi:hypothetical protein
MFRGSGQLVQEDAANEIVPAIPGRAASGYIGTGSNS